MEIEKYTKEDYLFGKAPFEYLYQFRGNRFMLERTLTVMSEAARKVGVRNLVTLYRKYESSQKKDIASLSYANATNYDGQELELLTGPWVADDTGVTKDGLYGPVIACVHPIMPVMRLINIDTGVEKLKIAYKKGRGWRHTIEDKKTLASNNSIIELANKGVAVNSESAKHLVKFLHDIENLNYERIPEKNSISRLGWIEGEGFSPYVDELVFDGDLNFRTYFESVTQKGNLAKWLDMARDVRESSVYGRLILAASFASVLVQPLSCLPFFVHLWGGTEVGKTVGLMLAASVWANPEPGRFIHTFNSTAVGREKSAGFVNSLPLILDELQIVSDKKQFDKDIYLLSEGAGRTRGNRNGGIDKTCTWSNCILTSGEQPITSSSSGGGAVNRIIEVECKEKLFSDARSVADTVRKNFGHAGKMFIDRLQEPGNLDRASEIFNQLKTEFEKQDTTEKQTLAICVILTADALATEWIFSDNRPLLVDEVLGFLQTRKAVSSNERAYEYICEYVVANRHKFVGGNDQGEVWGEISDIASKVYIIRSYFNKICEEQGFNPQAFLSWLKQTGKIETSGKGFTKTKKINKIPCNCVFLDIPWEDEQIELIDEFK